MNARLTRPPRLPDALLVAREPPGSGSWHHSPSKPTPKAPTRARGLGCWGAVSWEVVSHGGPGALPLMGARASKLCQQQPRAAATAGGEQTRSLPAGVALHFPPRRRRGGRPPGHSHQFHKLECNHIPSKSTESNTQSIVFKAAQTWTHTRLASNAHCIDGRVRRSALPAGASPRRLQLRALLLVPAPVPVLSLTFNRAIRHGPAC